MYHNFYSDKCVLGELLQEGYTINDSPVAFDTTVIEYGSVIAQNTVMTSKGDFIQFILNSNVSLYTSR